MRENERVFLDLVKQGVFKIYENGKIYKCKRTHRDWNGEYKECVPTLRKNRVKGYIQISFNYRKKRFYIHAHRTIWLYFNGEIPGDLEINHKNCIKDDNRLSNLELVTHSEQIIHAYKNGLMPCNKGENNGSHKLKNKDVLKIRKLLAKGIYQKKIAEIFGVTQTCIKNINIKRTWVWLN